MPKKRTCWHCAHELCYLKRRMEDLLTAGANVWNIDGDAAPGRAYEDLHVALARCCTLYKERVDAQKT